MAEERLKTRVGDLEFIWTRCCCGVKCYVKRQGAIAIEVAEYTFQDSIERTALRCQESALVLARSRLTS